MAGNHDSYSRLRDLPMLCSRFLSIRRGRLVGSSVAGGAERGEVRYAKHLF